ncbi:MAG: hypothetical protein IIC29_10335, partial [Chloroflexi bacterium]|nr:hypothetical protein [Chloroflexota bacterium]
MKRKGTIVTNEEKLTVLPWFSNSSYRAPGLNPGTRPFRRAKARVIMPVPNSSRAMGERSPVAIFARLMGRMNRSPAVGTCS